MSHLRQLLNDKTNMFLKKKQWRMKNIALRKQGNRKLGGKTMRRKYSSYSNSLAFFQKMNISYINGVYFSGAFSGENTETKAHSFNKSWWLFASEHCRKIREIFSTWKFPTFLSILIMLATEHYYLPLLLFGMVYIPKVLCSHLCALIFFSSRSLLHWKRHSVCINLCNSLQENHSPLRA